MSGVGLRVRVCDLALIFTMPEALDLYLPLSVHSFPSSSPRHTLTPNPLDACRRGRGPAVAFPGHPPPGPPHPALLPPHSSPLVRGLRSPLGGGTRPHRGRGRPAGGRARARPPADAGGGMGEVACLGLVGMLHAHMRTHKHASKDPGMQGGNANSMRAPAKHTHAFMAIAHAPAHTRTPMPMHARAHLAHTHVRRCTCTSALLTHAHVHAHARQASQIQV